MIPCFSSFPRFFGHFSWQFTVRHHLQSNTRGVHGCPGRPLIYAPSITMHILTHVLAMYWPCTGLVWKQNFTKSKTKIKLTEKDYQTFTFPVRNQAQNCAGDWINDPSVNSPVVKSHIHCDLFKVWNLNLCDKCHFWHFSFPPAELEYKSKRHKLQN